VSARALPWHHTASAALRRLERSDPVRDMGILRIILRAFRGRKAHELEAPVIDRVDVPPPSTDWRKRKLAQAAQRYGRPFKCAGGEMPRQVVLRDRVVIVDAERHT